MGVDRPHRLFARDDEWRRLETFHGSDLPGSRLAVVYGRRRQGKTSLLEAFAEASSGFYWQALEESSAQNLSHFSSAWNRFRGDNAGQEFTTWASAIDALFSVATPTFATLDEFGYLMAAAPEVPSLIQAKLTPSAQRSGKTRLVLCGSVFTQMKELLSGSAALRGRASLELIVRPFDYRTAARYWKLDANPEAAFSLHALVGGTPAYLPMSGGPPRHGDVDRWLIECVLDAASPLCREGRIVVTEDPTLADRALYWGTLGAIAEGATRKADIAAALGRTPTSVAFPIKVLTDGGWADELPDPFHPNRSSVDPIVRLYRLVIEPELNRIARGQSARVARDAKTLIARCIHGPHLEWMAGEWMLAHADEATLGGSARYVSPGVLQARGIKHQVDLVAVERGPSGGDRIHAIGEVKAGAERVGGEQLDRLDKICTLLPTRVAPTVRKLLVSRLGFTQELERVAARRGDVELVDLHRLYHGS